MNTFAWDCVAIVAVAKTLWPQIALGALMVLCRQWAAGANILPNSSIGYGSGNGNSRRRGSGPSFITEGDRLGFNSAFPPTTADQQKILIAYSLSFPILLFHPLEKGSFINKNPAPATFDNTLKAVLLCIEDQMTQSTNGWPLVVIVPLGDRDDAS